MAGTRLSRVVLAWLVLLPAFAVAQERREFTLGAEEAPVTVFADRIESLERERLLVAEGRVEIEQGVVRLEADRVEVNTETGEAVAVGRVVFFDGRDRLLGERIEYGFRTGTGIVYQADAFAEPHFFFTGDQMERLGEKAYRVRGGSFTTCEGDPPAWHVRWGQATAYLDEYLWGTSGSFWVWKIPLIPYVPIFAANLRRERHTGLLTPTFGLSETKGFTIRQPFFWAISDSLDLTLVPTYFEKKGFGLGALLRYIRREGSRGEVEGFALNDTETDDARWVVGLRHEERFTPRLTLLADLAEVSDDDYFAEFGDALDDRSRQRLDSTLSLTQRWDAWSFVGLLFYYEDLTTEADIELQRLPELRLTGFQQPVPGLPNLLYEFESSYINFVRDVGAAGQRLDLRPRLSYPVSPGGYFTLTPGVGLRETVYDTKVVGTVEEDGITVEETESAFFGRTLFEATLDAEARAYRIFETGGAFGTERVQHIIEPRVTYAYVSDPNRDDIPEYDAVDVIRKTNGITYSLTNRVMARAADTDAGRGGTWELLRFTLSQAYSFEDVDDEDVFENRLSDLRADLILEPTFGVRFRGTTTIDTTDWRVTSAITDAYYQAAAWGLTLGTRHGDGGDLDFVQGSVHARLGRRWAARFSSNYNVDTGTVIENRLEIDFRSQCWGITLAFVNRTDEDEVRVAVNLLELGQYGFGQIFGAQ